jgi:hypothetical protein
VLERVAGDVAILAAAAEAESMSGCDFRFAAREE